MQKTITKGNQAVIINQQGEDVWANLYVNVRDGFEKADITALNWKGRTLKGAEKWAERALA
jgi:hypothetical protein